MMCASVRQQMMLGVKNYLEIDRTQWMQNWPGQIVLNGSQVQIICHDDDDDDDDDVLALAHFPDI